MTTTLPRWMRAGLPLATILLLAGLALGLTTMPAEAASETDGGLSGDYAGEQDGAAFRMHLEQNGRFLTGWIAERTDHRDPLYGVVQGGKLAMLRASEPFEIWQGRIALPEIGGTWFGPGGRGAWHAAKVGPVLRVEKTVRPGVIRAGASTKVVYQIGIKNAGLETALNVELTDAHLPEFFELESIDIDRSFDNGAAPALNGGTIVLPLGDIPSGGSVMVRIEGTATPPAWGTFVNVATVTARNHRAVSDRAALWVVGPCLVDVQAHDAAGDLAFADVRATVVRPCVDVDHETGVRETDQRETDEPETDQRDTDRRDVDEPDNTDDGETRIAVTVDGAVRLGH